MNLFAAAKRFNTTPLCEYVGQNPPAAYGQLEVVADDSLGDGISSERRVLEVAPGTVLPAVNGTPAFYIGSDRWFAGIPSVDMYEGKVIREKYVIQKSVGSVSICPLDTLLYSSLGGTTSLPSSKQWVKDAEDIEQSSVVYPIVDIYVSKKDISLPCVVDVGGDYFWILDIRDTPHGFTVLRGVLLRYGSLSVFDFTFTPQTYSPSDDAYTAGTPTTAHVLMVDRSIIFSYSSLTADKYEPGDMTFLVSSYAMSAPKVGTLITPPSSSQQWRVLSVGNLGNNWEMHCRAAN